MRLQVAVTAGLCGRCVACNEQQATLSVTVGQLVQFLCTGCAAELKAALPERPDYAQQEQQARWACHNDLDTIRDSGVPAERIAAARDLQAQAARLLEALEAL